MADGLKKGQVLEGSVSEMLFPDRGIVRVGAESVVVKGALPGQKIRFRITKKRKGRAEGILLEVLERSPAEIESDCPHFPGCGGCLMRTLPYEEQLKLKEEQVRKVLGAVCDDLPFEGILPGPDTKEYRNKMEFSFGDSCKDGPLQLGLHRKGSFYDIATTDQCRIVDGDFRMILAQTLALAQSCALSYYHKVRHTGYLRHLLIRKGRYTGEILAALVTSSDYTRQEPADGDSTIPEGCEAVQTAQYGIVSGQPGPGSHGVEENGLQEEEFLQALACRLESLPLSGKLAGILHIRNDSVSDTITPESVRILRGRDYLFENLGRLTFKISAFSFFQTNSGGAMVLYDRVCDYASVRPGMHVFDLYSGTGTIAPMLAGTAKSVTGVEIVPEAVEAARENAAQNDLPNCRFIAGDVLRVLDELEEKPDMIILDPPREGVNPKALSRILSYGVSHIVYISCKVTSLARDLPAMFEAGYRIERCCCVDMFPATANIETVCLLSKFSNAIREQCVQTRKG